MAITCALLGAFLWFFPVRPAVAHPHAWIDVTVQILFDESGRVTGLREHWLFDPYYTTFATAGLGKTSGGKPSQDEIDALMHGNMNSLNDYGYFTKVEHGSTDVLFAPVTEISSAFLGERLGMTFVLPFKSPIDLKGSSFMYAIFDPTYYIEMLHAESDDAIRLEAAPADCTHRLIEPNPTMESVALAAALDRTQTAGDGLGALFAERVAVQCP